MATDYLPPKRLLKMEADKDGPAELAEDLTGDDKLKYDARCAEEARRKDITADGVAQEALDCYYEIEGWNGSSAEVWEVYGYSIEHVLKPALAEEARIKVALKLTLSADVMSTMLSVKHIQTVYGIEEFVPPVVEALPEEPAPKGEVVSE